MKVYLILVFLMIPVLLMAQKKVIVNESFDYPDGPIPDQWWSEGCQAIIEEGRLFVDADTSSYRASSVWLDREIAGDFIIEFDAFIVSSHENKNNINCFLLYSNPDGTSLRESQDERKNGVYGHYHKFNGFIVTFLANDGDENEARFRFRKNPNFELVQERLGYRCKSGEIYHIKIKKRKNRFRYWVNGKKFIDKKFDDLNPEYNQGLFGFRTWHTAIWWDNLKITQL